MIKFCFLKKTRLLNCKIAKLKHDLNFDFTGTSSDIKRKLVSRNISPNSGVSVTLSLCFKCVYFCHGNKRINFDQLYQFLVCQCPLIKTCLFQFIVTLFYYYLYDLVANK